MKKFVTRPMHLFYRSPKGEEVKKPFFIDMVFENSKKQIKYQLSIGSTIFDKERIAFLNWEDIELLFWDMCFKSHEELAFIKHHYNSYIIQKGSRSEDFFDWVLKCLNAIEIDLKQASNGDDAFLNYKYNKLFPWDVNGFDLIKQLILKWIFQSNKVYFKNIEVVNRYANGLNLFTEQLNTNATLSFSKSSDTYSQIQIAIACRVAGIFVTKDNAGLLLKNYSQTKSIAKLLQKLISRLDDIKKLSGNKSSDTKHLNDLNKAKELIALFSKEKEGNIIVKNESALFDINKIINEYLAQYYSKY